eukprot:jgi/Mesvir1/26095/Mv06814-RA.2
MHHPTVHVVSVNVMLSVPSGSTATAALPCFSPVATGSRLFPAWYAPRESISPSPVSLPMRAAVADQGSIRPSAVKAAAPGLGTRGHCQYCSISAMAAGQWVAGDPVGDLLLARMTGRCIGHPAMISCTAAGNTAASSGGQSKRDLTDVERELLLRAARIADSSVGLSAPHPNFGCVLARVTAEHDASTIAAPSHAQRGTVLGVAPCEGWAGPQIRGGRGRAPWVADAMAEPLRLVDMDSWGEGPWDMIVGEGRWFAQGTPTAEELAVRMAGERARGATAFLNLEPAHGTGELAAVEALVQGGVSRVVIGLLHPLPVMRGRAAAALRQAGVAVDVVGVQTEDGGTSNGAMAAAACLDVNRPLVYRCATQRPYSVLKYAMTLDGKIAAASGHSAWVSCTESRALVFQARARSDAVIVGGNTVRRDNPRLTTRREGGHQPIRIVMSKTGHLPMDANVWDVDHAPTILMTQHGVDPGMLAKLRSRGVEVVSFPQLTPAAVMDYCYLRGFLQVLWECGGTLSAPAIKDGVIHRVMSFIAPKIIGGKRAPTPVGDLDLDLMTDALPLANAQFQMAGVDVLVTGDLLEVERAPDGGPLQLASATERARAAIVAAGMSAETTAICARCLSGGAHEGQGVNGSTIAGSKEGGAAATGTSAMGTSAATATTNSTGTSTSSSAGGNGQDVAELPATCVPFFKSWDAYGALSNFSAHPVQLPCAGEECAVAALWGDDLRSGQLLWKTVEAFYQAHKFVGWCDVRAAEIQEEIRMAPSPEDAAQIGRRMARMYPKLVVCMGMRALQWATA